jgi:hypothetical protein
MFNSKFLASPKTTATCIINPSTRRQSKMFQRRASARRLQALHADEIITAPAITDINVIEVEPELAPEEITVLSPAINTAKHIEDAPEVVPPTADMVPAAVDQDNEISYSLKDANWGILPQNEALLEPDKIVPEIMQSDVLTVADSTIAATTVSSASPGNEPTFDISADKVADTTP